MFDAHKHTTRAWYQIIACYLCTMHSMIGISIWNKYYIQKSANNLFYKFDNVRMSSVCLECGAERDATDSFKKKQQISEQEHG